MTATATTTASDRLRGGRAHPQPGTGSVSIPRKAFTRMERIVPASSPGRPPASSAAGAWSIDGSLRLAHKVAALFERFLHRQRAAALESPKVDLDELLDIVPSISSAARVPGRIDRGRGSSAPGALEHHPARPGQARHLRGGRVVRPGRRVGGRTQRSGTRVRLTDPSCFTDSAPLHPFRKPTAAVRTNRATSRPSCNSMQSCTVAENAPSGRCTSRCSASSRSTPDMPTSSASRSWHDERADDPPAGFKSHHLHPEIPGRRTAPHCSPRTFAARCNFSRCCAGSHTESPPVIGGVLLGMMLALAGCGIARRRRRCLPPRGDTRSCSWVTSFSAGPQRGSPRRSRSRAGCSGGRSDEPGHGSPRRRNHGLTAGQVRREFRCVDGGRRVHGPLRCLPGRTWESGARPTVDRRRPAIDRRDPRTRHDSHLGGRAAVAPGLANAPVLKALADEGLCSRGPTVSWWRTGPTRSPTSKADSCPRCTTRGPSNQRPGMSFGRRRRLHR